MTCKPLGSACLQLHPLSGVKVPDVCSATIPSFVHGCYRSKLRSSCLSDKHFIQWASPRKWHMSDTLLSKADVSTIRYQWNLLWQCKRCSHISGFRIFVCFVLFLKLWWEVTAQLDSSCAQNVIQKSRWLLKSKYIIIVHTRALLQMPKAQSY